MSQDIEESFSRLATEHQLTAAIVLESSNDAETAKLLRQAAVSYKFAEYDRWDGGTYIFNVHLTVDAALYSRYTAQVCDAVKSALESAAAGVDAVWLGQVIVVPQLPSRENLVNNNALDIQEEWRGPTRHHMRFRSAAEAAMFDSLEKRQAELPRGDTFLIVPLPAVWTGRYRREPDFLIAYKGRIGAIEIDDPSHAQRYAADKSRDQLLDDCGVQLTRRIHVEDTADAGQRDQFISVFLERLARGIA